jgi:preprotein translocase subunit SecA
VQVLDQIWKEHLLALDHLRQGIGLRAYAQKDPLNEYKHDAFDLFDQMLAMLRETVTQVLCHMEISDENPEDLLDYDYDQLEESRNESGMAAITDNIHPAAEIQNIPLGNPKVIPANTKPEDVPPGWRLHEPIGRWVDPEDPETWGKVPRNAACPCGSGKKYKFCHGRAV